MRVSTSWGYQVAVNSMIDQQGKVNEAQMRLSSGKQYLTPAENPVVATSLIDFNQNIQENQQYQVNIGAAKAKLEMEQSNVTSATDVLQSIRELAVQGMNDSNTLQDRQQIATHIDQLNKQLLTIANTQDANGDYLFSGTATNQRAYTDTPDYAYQGNDGQRNIIIGPADRQVTNGDSGNAVFGGITTPPLTAGNIDNIMQAVAQLSTDLRANSPNTASLADIDKGMQRIEIVKASVGARLQAIGTQESINAQTILDNKTTSSAIGDLDYASAISQFTQQQNSLTAAQQAFVKVKGLSLFQYM